MARKTTLTLLLFIIAVGFSLLFGELALRLWMPESISYKAVRQSDPITHHSLRPSSHYTLREKEFAVEVRTNSLGMRDNEYVPSGENEFRVLVLGDSFTEGYGVPVESCFVQFLEQGLNTLQLNGRKVEVFNAGVSGYSPLLEYLYLKERGLALKPHLVIQCYDMTDVQEDIMYAEDAEFDAAGVPILVSPSVKNFGHTSLFPEGGLKTFLNQYSYLYAAVKTYLSGVGPQIPFDPMDIRANRYLHTMDSTDGRWAQWFAQSESYIACTSRILREKNIPFVLSVHPKGHQVSTSEWIEGRKYWGLENRVYNSAIFRSLELFTQSQGIAFLNMTSTFQRRSSGNLYFSIDDHWTPAGHRVAADTLYYFLVEHGLVPVQQNSLRPQGSR